jgi:hypothetical protein
LQRKGHHPKDKTQIINNIKPQKGAKFRFPKSQQKNATSNDAITNSQTTINQLFLPETLVSPKKTNTQIRIQSHKHNYPGANSYKITIKKMGHRPWKNRNRKRGIFRSWNQFPSNCFLGIKH